MGWQFTTFTKWYAAHRSPRDKWDRIVAVVFGAVGIIVLERYPLYIMLAVGLPLAALVGWLLHRRRIRRMRPL